MASVKVYGASDDLIEVQGDLHEEFSGSDEERYLAFSDGTVLEVVYSDHGVWRVHRVAEGSAKYERQDAPGDDGSDADGVPLYSDRVTLTGDLRWVVCGDAMAKAKR